MKKSTKISLVLVPALAALSTACGEAPAEDRDVYTSQQECMQDWDLDLCETMSPDDDREYRQTHGHGHSSVFFWGPRYGRGDRTVMRNGQIVTPRGNSSKMPSYAITSRSSSFARGGSTTPRSVSTGGFGGGSRGGGTTSGG